MRSAKISFISLALAFACIVLAAVDSPPSLPTITSLSVSGTNLNFIVTLPPGLEQAVLEMRPTLTASWQQVTGLDISNGGEMVQFSIPKPPLESVFFRLNATMRATTNAQLSAELQYVTIAPLGLAGTNSEPPTEAVFHFKGVIDGSDRIVITREGASWEHVNWSWPTGSVTVNEVQWNPLAKNFLTTTGAIAFLPETFSLSAVSLEKIEGRDVVALERTNQALIVYLDDTLSGAAPYEFKIHFHPVTAESAPSPASAEAHLKISAQIDGSDTLKITSQEATWTHQTWSPPEAVKLNDIAWDLRQTNVLANVGTNAFLPSDIDLSTAKIVRRQGRDLITMWADHEAVWVSFADNPNGSDACELEISFGK